MIMEVEVEGMEVDVKVVEVEVVRRGGERLLGQPRIPESCAIWDFFYVMEKYMKKESSWWNTLNNCGFRYLKV